VLSPNILRSDENVEINNNLDATLMPKLAALIVLVICCWNPAMGQDAAQPPSNEDAALAAAVNNPLANMISVPIQYDWNSGYGDEDGTSNVLLMQPIIPFEISENWNIVTRTIIHIVLKQTDIAGNSGSQSGLGDILASQWLSPAKPTKLGGLGDLVWGIGPAMSIPTATSSMTGSGKFSIGPTAIALLMNRGWVVGALANQLWSVAGKDDRASVNTLFVQPFIVYTTKTHYSFGINTEATYDWNADEWSVPINLYLSKLIAVGSQKMSAKVGIRYWADTFEGGPEGWGVRFALTLLFPSK